MDTDPIVVETGKKIFGLFTMPKMLLERSGVDWDSPTDEDYQNITLLIPMISMLLVQIFPQVEAFLREGLERHDEAERIKREGLGDLDRPE